MDALFIHMHVWVLASVMVGVLGAGVVTIRILSLNKPLDAVVVVVVVVEVVVVVVVVLVVVVGIVVVAEVGVCDICHHKAEERSVCELIGLGGGLGLRVSVR